MAGYRGRTGDRKEAQELGVESRDDQSAGRSGWDRIAPGYDEFVTPSHLWLAGEGLRRAGLRSGMRFLDVAAGSGALSIPAARAGADVLAIDRSKPMLECLRARAHQEGLDIETRVMDGHALDLDDGGFDMSGSQFGVMLFSDMPRGIQEMVRVTRPGGRVALLAYGAPEEIEFLQFFTRAVQAVRPDFPGLPTDPPPLPLQLQDPERVRKELAAAGLHDVQVQTVTETMEFPTGKSLWDWLVSSNPIVESLLDDVGVTDGELNAVEQTLENLIGARADEDGPARLTSPVNIGIGTVGTT